MAYIDEQRKARQTKDQQIRDRFHYKKPTETHQVYFDGVTARLDRLIEFVLQIPDGQERAVALTQLGLARMCINAAIANTPEEKFAEYNA